jgi:hypothetical protein
MMTSDGDGDGEVKNDDESDGGDANGGDDDGRQSWRAYVSNERACTSTCTLTHTGSNLC